MLLPNCPTSHSVRFSCCGCCCGQLLNSVCNSVPSLRLIFITNLLSLIHCSVTQMLKCIWSFRNQPTQRWLIITCCWWQLVVESCCAIIYPNIYIFLYLIGVIFHCHHHQYDVTLTNALFSNWFTCTILQFREMQCFGLKLFLFSHLLAPGFKSNDYNLQLQSP